MAAIILSSPRATEVSVYVVRAFVQLRELVVSNKEVALRLDELENKTDLMSLKQETFEHNARVQLKQIFDALRELMATPEPAKKRPIGFVVRLLQHVPHSPKLNPIHFPYIAGRKQKRPTGNAVSL